MKNIIITLLIVLVVLFGVYFLNKQLTYDIDTSQNQPIIDNTIQPQNNEGEEENPQINEKEKEQTIIGKSVEGLDITAYHYGEGETEILFVGGIHGGYGWATSLLAYKTIDSLKLDSSINPAEIKVTVIPTLNPDGLNKIIGTAERFELADAPTTNIDTSAGRFNANEVDLNRNFDCNWEATSKWQNKTVSGGTEAFSEPEAQAVKNYIEQNKPKAVVVWYSAGGGVYASSCNNEISAKTRALTNIYAQASTYVGYEEFDSYAITGDMVNWLAKENIPAISVLLSTHNDIEWEKNQAGIKAIINHYSN
ncbi:MAG: hypothetical protein KAS02_00855 [Candidatus Pacebacteria bacterium]|nr:hypothetical protein [Candidatus Paceibacterota bacterium]